ncbi:hypothetical protein [Salegentibacter salegens]|uniref:CDP-Glycerol:Poly(Glycerophosphate) glycerophosphotransferase n=1 Tax=Salegentibacter salegens TaxID=143223 RepID=A0A1M7HD95_9FLAO|nr:hypothetical protein [Salegentibacter salegens]PRX43502.1 hypothetical protein LY58_02310 [Salegentibacter salegens]SHM26323.1 hypothetical protein SAMN05878281_0083 [Salegentibacter salegens]
MEKNKIDHTVLSNYFAQWAEEYPVETWIIGGINIWPILKKSIFFTILVENGGKNQQISPIYIRAYKKIKKLIKAWIYVKRLKLEKANFLFSSSYQQRIFYKDREFNRFIEPLMDYLEEQGEKSYLLEYPEVKKERAYRPERIVDIQCMLALYSSSKNKNKYVEELKQLARFDEFLENVYVKTNLDAGYNKNRLIRIILSIKSWEKVYTKIIKLTNPRYVLGLVYYSDAIYGLNLAARKLGVTSIDLQHGGMGKAHPAYFFNKIPAEGYNLLPDIFWVWSDSDYKNINNWAKKTPHNVLLGGNPWIGLLGKKENNKKSINKKRPVILFTLQPINDIIPSYLYKIIAETTEEFEWWLRFHPRMTGEEKKGVLDKLSNFGILDSITFDYSSKAPLPVVLRECDLHISFSSGSITEAAIMHRFSLILSETGINFYENLIEEGWAFPCIERDPQIIKNKIRIYLERGQNSILNKEVDYRETLKLLLKET